MSLNVIPVEATVSLASMSTSVSGNLYDMTMGSGNSAKSVNWFNIGMAICLLAVAVYIVYDLTKVQEDVPNINHQ